MYGNYQTARPFLFNTNTAMKKYIASSHIAINVVVFDGDKSFNQHVSFSALTGGGSVFYTDNPKLQKAIESHYKFGALFRLDSTFVPEAQRKTNKKPRPAVAPETAEVEVEDTDNDTDETDDGTQAKVIAVSDADDAKAYLSEHFGLSRTKLKSMKAIQEAAEAHGIVFEGI